MALKRQMMKCAVQVQRFEIVCRLVRIELVDCTVLEWHV